MGVACRAACVKAFRKTPMAFVDALCASMKSVVNTLVGLGNKIHCRLCTSLREVTAQKV